MTKSQLTEEELNELIKGAFNKIEKTEQFDSKLSLEQSNTLNWILTLTTLFIGLSIQNKESISNFCLKDGLFFMEKIIFAISVILLITYKIIFQDYEKKKKSFLGNLHTHSFELLFDIKPLLRTKISNSPMFTTSFINNFRNGEFIPDYDPDRKKALKKIDKAISLYGKLLKLIYSATMIAFTINLTIITILIFNIKNSG
jgi:hypothetical protein